VSHGAGQEITPLSAENEKEGRELVQRSARNLFALPGLDAEFHFKIQAYEQSLAGSGHYLQSGDGSEKLFRLELSTQIDEYKATQQTIGGKQYLWIRRDFGPDKRSLARISMRRLREALNDAGPPLSLDPSPTWLGIVSLPKMLTSLGNWFDFERPQTAKLGDRQVLRLAGRMNRELRTQLLSGKKGQGGEQIPDAVELTLGTDQALPLFPYRIEYLKQRARDEGDGMTPLLTLDFFSAKVRSDIDSAKFEYSPGDQEVEDRTRLFLDRLGISVNEKGEK